MSKETNENKKEENELSEVQSENISESSDDNDKEQSAAETPTDLIDCETGDTDRSDAVTDTNTVPSESPDDNKKSPKSYKKMTLPTFILSATALVLAAVMVTFTICSSVYKKKLADAVKDDAAYGSETVMGTLEFFSTFFKTFSYYDLDENKLMTNALKAYVAATGDEYAEYYTAEEYAAMTDANAGKSQGIGITVIYSQFDYDGGDFAIKVVSVLPDSPGYKSGLLVGDMICYAGIGENKASVASLGYTQAVNQLRGEAGTNAEFTVLRPKDDGTYEEKEFTVLREEYTSESVISHICTTDASVGIVRLLQFDLTTPLQFSAAIDDLKAKGCTNFVLDVRNNGGGDLQSIVAVLSYFLDEGKTIISTKTKSGEEEIIKVAPVSYKGDYAGCSVSSSDIGKYRDLKTVVLCNGNTASAAELFTANFRDHGLADTVGTRTYGKGSMQSIYSLAMFGYDGAVKLTTRMYYPPCGISYNGEGIEPSDIVELSEEASATNIYELSDDKDNQLQKALTHFN